MIRSSIYHSYCENQDGADFFASVKKNVPTRGDIPPEYQWHLSDMYATREDWTAAYQSGKEDLTKVSDLQTTITDSPEQLLTALTLQDSIGMRVGRLYAYARMHRDSDASVTEYQALTDKAERLASEASSACAYIEPAILKLDESTLTEWSCDDKFAPYRFYFTELNRERKHILSSEQEALLAQVSELTTAPRNIFNMLTSADMTFPSTPNEEGELVPLSEGRFMSFLRSSDRNVRKSAFDNLFGVYQSHKNTLASTLGSSIKNNLFNARVRHYGSALEEGLSGANIPVSVYHNLLDTIHEHLPALHEYVALKKSVLQLDDIHMYDLYAPLAKEVTSDIPFTEGFRHVKEALRPLGETYLADMEHGVTSGWVDIYENKGKRSGAYSWGIYGVHPFVLLNYNNSYNSVSTLAHELGHAMHSYYSSHTQPYRNASYTIFNAEVASTTNEILLFDYFLAKASSREEKLFLYNQYLEQVRTTVYRQALFAEFERTVYQTLEEGGSATADYLGDVWLELNRKYYGDDIVLDDLIRYEWARIPHFYTHFYVYQYATGYSAATALAEALQSKEQDAQEKYLHFLASGGSDYSLTLLKNAGVDMSSPHPIAITLEKFAERLKEFAALLSQS